MKSTQATVMPLAQSAADFPSADELAALRAWYEGLQARAAVSKYLGHNKADGQSSRAMLGAIRSKLAAYASVRQRQDLASVFDHSAQERHHRRRAVLATIENLRHLPAPQPSVTDYVERWLPTRAANALQKHGLRTLADLTVRVPRRRRWWTVVPGLGATNAKVIETFFAAHPLLTEQARALLPEQFVQDVVPWERLAVPAELDGSRGAFRAPRATCTLSASTDYQAIQSWLSLHESESTQRAYKKEAERLLLWAVLERRKPLSSLTADDAIAYRGFLRRPAPAIRWIGTARPRTANDWKPFAGSLSPRSVAYSLSVIGAMFRWLIQQRYTLANPFAGVKVRGASRAEPSAASRVFTEGEWALIQAAAQGLEWRHGWTAPAAQRLQFVLSFSFGTGLRIGEMVSAKLGQVELDGRGDHWLHVMGKGGKEGKVALPPLARLALERYLAHRQLPLSYSKWNPETALVGCLGSDDVCGVTTARLWAVLRRFFHQVAEVVQTDHPGTAKKLRAASAHWMRHTHATHALSHGVDLTIVRDNLRHASVQTTSNYLHSDTLARAKQMGEAFKSC